MLEGPPKPSRANTTHPSRCCGDHRLQLPALPSVVVCSSSSPATLSTSVYSDLICLSEAPIETRQNQDYYFYTNWKWNICIYRGFFLSFPAEFIFGPLLSTST